MLRILLAVVVALPSICQEPVETEPPMPEESTVKDSPGYTQVLGGGYIREVTEGGVKTKWVVIPGMINMNAGVIEVFATLGPKDHEAVMKVFCNIFTLNIALLNLGLKPGDIPQNYGKDDASDVGRVLAFVQFKDEKGNVKTYRAEDFLSLASNGNSMPRVGWMYQAKFEAIGEGRQLLRAGESQLLVTSWRDPWSLVDNPLKEAVNDDFLVINKSVVPKAGTQVLVIFRKPKKEEMKEIKEIEKKLYEK